MSLREWCEGRDARCQGQRTDGRQVEFCKVYSYGRQPSLQPSYVLVCEFPASDIRSRASVSSSCSIDA